MDRSRMVVWGTYDLGKPRVRILLRGLYENGVSLHECHADVWRGIEDKSQIRGVAPKFKAVGRLLVSYPKLIWCYLRAPAHDVVLVPYMGHLDVLVLWPFAKLRGARVVWDAFISVYDTVVEDRRLVGRLNPIAWMLHAWEWLATRAANLTLLDTQAHADYFRVRYGLTEDRLGVAFVGAEVDKFPPLPPLESKAKESPFLVLFYGQFIPLHGIETIVKAARRLDDGSVHWVLIGKGQEEEKIRDMLAEHPVDNLEWLPWVSYDELINWIRRADVCLGIFGDSEKAARVIPNKVFQVLSAGRPLITRDSRAIRELLRANDQGVRFVPPGDDQGLAEAILQLAAERDLLVDQPLYARLGARISAAGVAGQLLAAIDRERG